MLMSAPGMLREGAFNCLYTQKWLLQPDVEMDFSETEQFNSSD